MQETPTVYRLDLKAEPDNLSVDEALLVKDRKVISIQNGQGIVLEMKNTTNATKIQGQSSPLSSPLVITATNLITSALAEFIKDVGVLMTFDQTVIRKDFEEFVSAEEIISAKSRKELR